MNLALKLPSNLMLTLLTAFSGLFAVAGFSPFQHWALSLFGFLLLLIVLIRANSSVKAFKLGLLFGIIFYMAGLHWFFNVTQSVDENFIGAITFILLSVFFILALYPAFVALLLFSIQKYFSLPWLLVVFAFIWTFSEWLRSWVLGGLPLLQPAHAFLDTPLTGFAPLGGELLMTFMVMLSCSLIAIILFCKKWFHQTVSIILLAAIWFLGYFFQNIDWTDHGDKQLLVRVIHGEPDADKKFKRYYAVDTLKQYLIYSQSTPKPDLVIWPESSLAYDFRQIKRYLLPEARKLADQGTHILLGSYLSAGNKAFNSLFLANNPREYYNKQHLIPFGEFTPKIPFLDLKKYLPDLNKDDLSPGSPMQKSISIGEHVLAPAICYEMIFSNEFRQRWKHSNALVVVSDLSWFENTWGIEQLHQLSRLRSLESGKPTLSATNFGITEVINAKGEVISSTRGGKPYTDAKIVLSIVETPYTKFGNKPLLIVLFGFFLFMILKFKFNLLVTR